jgi:uncharacterized membrane protein
MTATHPANRGQHYKRLTIVLVAIGMASLLIGIEIGRNLAGLVGYAVCVLGILVVTLYGQFSDSVTLMDERERRLHERASNATVSLVSYVGLPSVVTLYLLDATGRYVIGPTLWGTIWALSAFYLLWGGVYTLFRLRS